jgi:hypothetical protein
LTPLVADAVRGRVGGVAQAVQGPNGHLDATTTATGGSILQLTDLHEGAMAVFAEADAPLRARNVCEAMDLDLVPNNINNVRIKPKLLTGRGTFDETEQGLLTRPRP